MLIDILMIINRRWSLIVIIFSLIEIISSTWLILLGLIANNSIYLIQLIFNLFALPCNHFVVCGLIPIISSWSLRISSIRKNSVSFTWMTSIISSVLLFVLLENCETIWQLELWLFHLKIQVVLLLSIILGMNSIDSHD